MSAYRLDGVDIDLEYPAAMERQAPLEGALSRLSAVTCAFSLMHSADRYPKPHSVDARPSLSSRSPDRFHRCVHHSPYQAPFRILLLSTKPHLLPIGSCAALKLIRSRLPLPTSTS